MMCVTDGVIENVGLRYLGLCTYKWLGRKWIMTGSVINAGKYLMW